MKVVQINVTCGEGSTGKICLALSGLLDERKIENHILYSYGKSANKHGVKYTSNGYVKYQALKSRINGKYGFNTKRATAKLVDELRSVKPSIVHLHNIHGHNVDLNALFTYLKEEKLKVVWTFHDCWAFTGYCPYFTLAQCDKWKTKCNDCPQRKAYSWFFDKSEWLYEKKKELFSDLDLTIVTPSQWLADLVKQSFLKSYPVKVINNGIDLSVFKPTDSDFKAKHGIRENQHVILGVAFGWGKSKGLDVFVELSKRLPENYRIVLVGTSEKTDKQLPENIISIRRTQDQAALAEIYTAADLFVNTTREENFPTVNIEALACGTPVLTFNTGGSPEIIDDLCGKTVVCDDVDSLEKEITEICEHSVFTSKDCVNRAKLYNQDERFREYIELYDTIDQSK